MITNLFSTFDPISSLTIIQLNWIRISIFLLIIYPLFWVVKPKVTCFWPLLLNFITKEFILIFNSYKNIILFISLFVFILLNNFIGLIPYTFTSTAHIRVTLSLALTVWLAVVSFGWINYTKSSLAHLVPLGTPPVLIPFMVIIEMISNLIRPITLSVRLAANMTAGHILLVLLGENIVGLGILLLSLLIVVQLILVLLEIAVAIIQSYVFATLSTLYAREV